MDAKVFTTELAASKNTLDHDLRVKRAKVYPHEVWYFLACLIALVTVFQILSFLLAKFFRRSRLDGFSVSDAEKSASNGAPSSNGRFRLRNVPLAVVNLYRVVAFRLTIDVGSFSLNFAEVVLTLMYMAALYTWTFINTKNVSGQMDPKYWNNRAGTIAASQIPLITVLGTKNNVVSWITGISYEKLNYLHRMSARVVFVLLWVHAGARIQSGVLTDRVEVWFRLGCMALACLSLLCIVSLRPIRGRAYELFFYVHMITVLLFLVGAYYHTKEFAFETYIWPSMVVWGFDRAIRILRVVTFNHLYFVSGSQSRSLDATVELLTPHLVRMTMKRPNHFHWTPGQVAYLITPEVSTLPFEAHPFTIASYNSSMSRKEITLESQSDSSPRHSQEKMEESPIAYWKEVVFLINVREGFTKRLADVATKQGTVKVYMDGPYGFSQDVSLYDTMVLVAGGSGVSYTLPLLLEIIETVRSGKSTCQRVVFIWSIRDARHVKWISDALNSALQLVPQSLSVQLHIFVTGSDIPSGISEWDAESIESGGDGTKELTNETNPRSVSSLLSLPNVNLTQGRPPLGKMLADEAEDTRGGSMSVSVCGSHSISTAVRKGLGFSVAGPATILKGGASVTLHVESFGYA